MKARYLYAPLSTHRQSTVTYQYQARNSSVSEASRFLSIKTASTGRLRKCSASPKKNARPGTLPVLPAILYGACCNKKGPLASEVSPDHSTGTKVMSRHDVTECVSSRILTPMQSPEQVTSRWVTVGECGWTERSAENHKDALFVSRPYETGTYCCRFLQERDRIRHGTEL